MVYSASVAIAPATTITGAFTILRLLDSEYQLGKKMKFASSARHRLDARYALLVVVDVGPWLGSRAMDNKFGIGNEPSYSPRSVRMEDCFSYIVRKSHIVYDNNCVVINKSFKYNVWLSSIKFNY